MKSKISNIQIGVMGGAFKYSKEAIIASFKVGKEIAKQNCTLITGATTGIPYAAIIGANENNGLTIGISPASNSSEHSLQYKKPLDGLDAIVFTGMGYNGREPILTSSCDGLICIGGEFGTLIEFGQGYYNGKVLGVLLGIGGITDFIKNILQNIETNFGSEIIYSSEPEQLVNEVIKKVENRKISPKHIYKQSNESGLDVRIIIENEK
jgi:uncharacterized protein (TIGR00725 family)